MSDYLPPDVLTDIFIRLPVKALLRCTSVCSSWHSFITGPTFIDAHLNYHRTHTSLLLTRSCLEKSKKEVYALHSNDESFIPYSNFEFPSPCCICNSYYRVVGSCNGVVCLSDDELSYADDIILLNPTISKWMRLPPPRVTFETHGGFDHAIGFGFDAASGDYKVVRIVRLIDAGGMEIDIYSLSSHSWTNASHLAAGFKHFLPGCAPQAYVNGATHWVGWDKRTRIGAILSFHMEVEVFGCIKLPLASRFELQLMPWIFNPRPMVIEGLLSLVDRHDEKCSIWMMKEYGVSSSWTKQLDIDLSIRVNRTGRFSNKFSIKIDRVIGLTKDGKILVEVGEQLCCYDPEARVEEEVGINEDDEERFRLFEEGGVMFYIAQDTRLPDDPEVKQLKKLGILGYRKSLHAESYTPSLVLIGTRPHSEEDDATCQSNEIKINDLAENRSVAGRQNQLRIKDV